MKNKGKQANLLVSIITPTKNSENTIDANLSSIQNQTYPTIEHIIIDSCSQDNTIKKVKSYNHYLKILSEPDNGIAEAFNKGLSLAKGDIIGILNSDDYYAPDIIKHVASIYQNSQCNFILHGNLNFFDGKIKNYIKKPRPLAKCFFYLDQPFYHPTVFVPRQLYEKIGNFNEQFKIAMDYDFLLRAMLQGVRFYYLPKALAHFRVGGKANQNARACHKEVLQSQLQNGLNPYICYLTFFLKMGINTIKNSFLGKNFFI